MIVVDTNVISELMRPAPSRAVRQWVRARSGRALYTSAVTIAEIRYGIERQPDGRRRELLKSAAGGLFELFADQILPFDSAAAEQYALVVSRREKLGMPIDGFDGQIAAICRAREMALATRNVADFRDTGVDLIDPWHGEE